MKHLDLFSGIGGFALAAEWAGYETVQFVEIESFPCKVLQKHWPDVPIHDDIKTFNGKKYAGTINLLTGGFPCQPYSVAGLRKGKEDDRALWSEALRIVQEVKPYWCVFENVAGILSMGFKHYVSDMENAGYEVQCFVIPACATGAPHRRDRVWIVANCKELWNWRFIGESEVGQISEFRECFEPSAITNTSSAGCQERDVTAKPDGEGQHSRSFDAESWRQKWTDVATRLCRVDDGIPRRMDRSKRLKALGNAIVPQVAYEIIRCIYASKPYR